MAYELQRSTRTCKYCSDNLAIHPPPPIPPPPPDNVAQQKHAIGQTCKLNPPLEHMSVTVYAWSQADRHHIIRVKAMDKPC